MLTALLISGLMAAASEPPPRVIKPVEQIAQATDEINESIVGWSRDRCLSDGTKDRWHCVVDYAAIDGTTMRVRYSVAPELTRKRRNGHWVGRWKPTGRLAVVRFDRARDR